MLRSRFIILGVLAVIAIFVVVFILSKGQGEKQGPPPPLTKPNIETRTEGVKIQFESTLNKSILSIPSTLPVYQIAKSQISDADALNIGRGLGFSELPQRFTSPHEGTVLLWMNNSGVLKIVPGLSLIDYKINIDNVPSGSFPSEQELVEKAKSILADKKLINTNADFDKIEYINFQTGAEFAKTTKQLADVALVSFVQKVDGYPIINSTPAIGIITIGLTKDGTLYSAYINQTETTNQTGTYKIKDFDKLVSSLPDSQLQSLDNGKIDLTFLGISTVRKIVIKNAKIAYLREYTPSQTFLQPIFVLEGDAVLQDGRVVSSLSYLPAISNEAFATPEP